MRKRFYSIRPPSISLDISVVVPVRDEEMNILPLGHEITRAMDSTGRRWECIWVDDGSTDGSVDNMCVLNKKDPRHVWLELDGNHGQSAAIAVGVSNAHGKLIATLDGDGQNDPADIPRLVEILTTEKADMVQGWRRNRHVPFTRVVSSRIANAFRNTLTAESIRDVGCSLRVFDREFAEDLIAFDGMHRFLPTLCRMNGLGRIIETPVSDRPRVHGQAKYGVRNRLWVGIADTIALRWMARRLVHPRLRLEKKGKIPAGWAERMEDH